MILKILLILLTFSSLYGAERPISSKHALFYDAIHGNIEAIKSLLDQGADINQRSSHGMTALYYALEKYKNGHGNVVESLLCIGNKYKNVIEYLVSQGADVNQADFNGIAPLHIAANYGHLELVQLLVSKGADINRKTLHGLTPLHNAAISGNLKLVEFFISQGADKNQTDMWGEAALYYAVKNGHLDIIEYLISLAIKEHLQFINAIKHSKI